MADEQNEPFSQPAGNQGATPLPGEQQWNPVQAQQPAEPTQPSQGGGLGDPLHSVRQRIEDQIGQAIDHYAGHVPGGQQFTPEVKKAVAGLLDGLQSQLEREAANRLGVGGASGGTTSRGSQGGETL